MWYKRSYLQNRNRFTDIENKLNDFPRGKGTRGINYKLKINRYTSLYIK